MWILKGTFYGVLAFVVFGLFFFSGNILSRPMQQLAYPRFGISPTVTRGSGPHSFSWFALAVCMHGGWRRFVTSLNGPGVGGFIARFNSRADYTPGFREAGGRALALGWPSGNKDTSRTQS